MSNQSKYWDKIFQQYQESGLTRPAFCKQYGLSYSQFQYQWYKQNQAGKVNRFRTTREPETHVFEAIAISIPSDESIVSDTPVELVICLPNQIRCEVRCGLKSTGLPALLKQLVSLC